MGSPTKNSGVESAYLVPLLKYRRKIEELVNDESIFPAEIFDNSRIKKTLEEYFAGNISLHIEINALLSFGILNRLLPCNGIEL